MPREQSHLGPLITIRNTDTGDREAIIACVRVAFATGGHNGEEEVQIVLSTWSRRAAPPELDLVALADGAVVGHVLGGRGRLGDREVIGLAPLAVIPKHQRQGVGSRLVVELIARADTGGWPLVVVLGDPGFYGRFGFEPASGLGIEYSAVGRGDPHFQARRLSRFDQSLHGEFRYCWELGGGSTDR